MQNTVVIKIGGSILTKKELLFDFEEAKKLKEFFSSFSSTKFILTTGGGYICREYQSLIRTHGYTEYDEHYVGTIVCNLNAVVLRSVFGELAEDKVLALDSINKEEQIEFSKQFLIAGAGNPGPSSDWDACWLAIRSNAKFVITLKDTDAVYSQDPDINPNAELLSKINWSEYLSIIGNPSAHKPGGNLPVDPVAAKLAQQNGIKFYVVNGVNLSNLKMLMEGGDYTGTEIY